MISSRPCLLVFMPCVISYWVRARPSYLLVTKKMWEKNDGMSILRLGSRESMASVLLALSLSFTLSLTLSEVRSCVVSPQGGAHILRNWGRPLVNSCRELRPVVQQTGKNWILPTTKNHVNEHGRSSFPSRAFRWNCGTPWHLGCSLVRDLGERHWAVPHLVPDPQRQWDNKCSLFYNCWVLG